MATHSSILAWRIPWTEEPGGLQFLGSQRVRHDLATKHTHTQSISKRYIGNMYESHYFLIYKPASDLSTIIHTDFVTGQSIMSRDWALEPGCLRSTHISITHWLCDLK